EHRPEHRPEPPEPRVPALDGLGVERGELRDLLPTRRGAGAHHQVPPVGVGREVTVLRIDLVAVTLELELAKHGRGHQADDVREGCDLEVGTPGVLGHCRAAHGLAPFEQAHAPSPLGEQRRRDQAIVPAAHDCHVEMASMLGVPRHLGAYPCHEKGRAAEGDLLSSQAWAILMAMSGGAPKASDRPDEISVEDESDMTSIMSSDQARALKQAAADDTGTLERDTAKPPPMDAPAEAVAIPKAPAVPSVAPATAAPEAVASPPPAEELKKE